MNIGVISDTHIDTEPTVYDKLRTVAEQFKQKDIDTVIHLGDIIGLDEFTEEEYAEIITNVDSIFSEFDMNYTLGNHDSETLSSDTFEELTGHELNTVIHETDTEVVLKVNTGTQVSMKNSDTMLPCGSLSSEGLELIKEYRDKDTMTLFSHYPIQYSPTYQSHNFFECRPEYTFPVNKLHFEKALGSYDGELPEIKIYSGHLHPKTNLTVTTEPFGIPLTVMSPIKQLNEDLEMYIDVPDTADMIVSV